MRPAEPQLFALFSEFVEELAGVRYEESASDILMDKLEVAASERGFDSLLDYYYFLRYDEAGGKKARQSLIDQLVVSETFFFRELPALESIVGSIIVPRVQAGLRTRIWSAACATGEEPLTIAMLLDDRGLLDSVQLVASDVSERSLERAKSGRFRPRSVRDPAPQHLIARYLKRRDDGFEIERRLIDRIQWRRINLVDSAAMSDVGKFEAIVCRNVLIYFSNEGIGRTVRELASHLVEDGVLLVGVAESLFRFDIGLTCEERGGVFYYRKGRS